MNKIKQIKSLLKNMQIDEFSCGVFKNECFIEVLSLFHIRPFAECYKFSQLT